MKHFFLFDCINFKPCQGDGWIGLHTTENPLGFNKQWDDTTQVNYENFDKNYPNYNADKSGDCVHMFGLDHG